MEHNIMSLFWMLFVYLHLITLSVSGECPSFCTCPSSSVANCSSASLTRIPNERFYLYTTTLDISNNSLEYLNKRSLRAMGLVSLVELNASRNHISIIHEEAFVGDSELRTVDLSSNKITFIEPKTFIYNPSLEKLSLSSNTFLILPEEGSFLLSKSLSVLHLSACNISHIPPKTFQNLPNVQELYISHNRIEVLYPLSGTERLNLLDLSNNHLTSLSSDIFTASPMLNHLDLSHNWLRTLNLSIMPQLIKVLHNRDLYDNQWLCDCSKLYPVYSWCRDNGVNFRLKCSDPRRFKGKLWTVFDKEVCENGGDSLDEVEQFMMIGDKLSEDRNHANYEIRQSLKYSSTQVPEHKETESIYPLTAGLLLVVLLISVIVFAALNSYWNSLIANRKSPAQTDPENIPLQKTL